MVRGKPGQPRPRGEITNPFGNDSENHDDDERFTNPFASKDEKKELSTNPFNDTKVTTQPSNAISTKPTKNVISRGSNPFGSEESLDQQKSRQPFRKKDVTNPFGKEDSIPTNPFGEKRGDTSPTKQKSNVNINPFDKPTDKSNDYDRKMASTSIQRQSQANPVRSKATGSFKEPIDPFESKEANPKVKGVNTSNNSFDFDSNFREDSEKKKAINTPLKSLFGGNKANTQVAKGDSNDSYAVVPLVTAMDTSRNNAKPSASSRRSQSEDVTKRREDQRLSRSPRRKEKQRVSMVGEVPTGGEKSLASWLRGNKSTDEDDFGGKGKKKEVKKKVTNKQRQGRQDEKARRKKALVQCWPYDDYHKEQEKYYQSLQERESSLTKTKGTSRRVSEYLGGYHSGSDEEKKNDRKNDEFGSNNFFERPAELPSIKEAVQNLSLFQFEKKAEERAISIVSTWLFDAGLIDELLVNGVEGSFMSPKPASLLDGSASSVVSSEGIEVGAHGIPIEGALKIEKEVEKLRSITHRELTLINTRLNDGVAASGSEVQELVDAVSATKNDLGRLRELTTYVSTGHKKDGEITLSEMRRGMLLVDFPRLKRSINARRNIFRCFRELEFFSQIPMTCDRLREQLHEGEWTDNEWNTIRDVCMEHVELEILLVEAEAGMKAWFDDENEGDDDASLPSLKSNRSLRKSWRTRQASLSSHYEVVDKFLSKHVKNVWELGDEIRMRILSGVGSSFDIALKNPGAVVALVEAVEVYEQAAEQYKKVHGDESQSFASDRNRLHFTDMRAAALAQLYQDFELRGLEIFRAIHMQAADMTEEKDALNSQFSAVLRAANELVTEIDVVKNQMAPCFATHWHVEMLWSSCVAHVCSNQIIQQIGGPDGQSLPELHVTQLLDLVAWVEFFRETIEDAFPSIAKMHAKKTYFDEKPDLFAGDNKEVNMENATDNLAWVNNMLWEVHRLAQEEFLVRTRSQTDEWLNNVYNANRETHQTIELRLTTSLCEDVFSLAAVQLRTIRERLSRKSEALVMAVCVIFSQLRAKQIGSRDKFLQELETCCAAANDFQRMAEQCEDVLQDLLEHCDLPEQSIKMLEDACMTLVSLYSADAVFASQKTHIYIFQPIWRTISDDIFGPKWEDDLTNNELALSLTRTLEDFMGDLETFLDEFMLKKAVDALVTSSVIFYVKCLLLKAEKHNSNRVSWFGNVEKSFERMFGDIKVIRDYFEALAEGMPALTKHIEKEFELLTTVQELMKIAAGSMESEPRDFILVLHKVIRDVNITKKIVGDLWHLVKPWEERNVCDITVSLEESLVAVCPPDNLPKSGRLNVPGLRLDETLAKLYNESKRKRPVVAG